jgi:hypothetical protein
MKLSDGAADLMRAGAVYIGGRDKNGFPSCIFLDRNKNSNFLHKASEKSGQRHRDKTERMFYICVGRAEKILHDPEICRKIQFHCRHGRQRYETPNRNFFLGLNKKDLIKGLINLFQDNLNGFNIRCYIYKAPWTFSMIWSVVKRKFIFGLKSLK